MVPDIVGGQKVALPSVNVAEALGVGAARSSLGLDGAGVKIGIISDSFDALGGAATDEADGALPSASDVHVLKDDPSGRDEGRAMAEIVHAVAPDAQIYFYASDKSSKNFAAGVAAMQAAGCSIICDDVTCPKEPFFQMGDTIEQAIETFTAAGGTYFTCASNAGPHAAYQEAWSGTDVSLPGIGAVQALDFGSPSAPDPLETVHLSAKVPTDFDLQWAQPWASIDGHGSSFSLGLAIYDPQGNLVKSANVDATGGDPVQSIGFTPAVSGDYSVAIYWNGGAAPQGLVKLVGNNNAASGVSFADPSSTGPIFGHNADPAAITVGAVKLSDTPAYGGTLKSEPFSAGGTNETLFDPKGALLSTTTSHATPDISGPDGQETTLPASDLNPFFGTSAATPAVAALGGLMLEADPALTSAEIRSILQGTAIPFGTQTQAGAGYAQAPGALALAEQSNTALRDDFGGDGKSDVLWQGADGDAEIAGIRGGTVAKPTVLEGPGGAGWTAVGSGDFSAPGQSDVLWQDRTGAVAVTDIVAGREQATHLLPFDFGPNWHVVEAGDFNGDGHSDILFQDSRTDALKIATMDGDEVAGVSDLSSPGSGWTAEGVGDFNADGRSDILFQDAATGALSIWTMDGTSVARQDVLATSPGAGTTVAGIGDFDGVGDAEILLRGSDGALSIWSVDGSTVTSNHAIATQPGADWLVAGVGDFNGSGHDDILLRNATTGATEIDSPRIHGASAITPLDGTPPSAWKALVH